MKGILEALERRGQAISGFFGDLFFGDLFSGGTPFTYVPPWSIGASMEHERVVREMLGAQVGLPTSFLGLGRAYGVLAAKPPSLQEGKVNVQLKLTRIDKEHVLVEVECIQRIVHNNKELRELTAKLIEEYAEQYLFQAAIQKATIAPQREPGAEGVQSGEAKT